MTNYRGWFSVILAGAVLLLSACEKEAAPKSVFGRDTESGAEDSDSANDTGADSQSDDTSTTSDGDSDGDTDGDGDSDSDTDSDTDTDSDSETGVVCIDMDSDANCIPFDCDDSNPAVFLGAVEIYDNAVDEDCDGTANVTADTDVGGDPTTCAQAAANRTYMGCDFWPTVTYNMVWYNFAGQAGFEFAVVVANDQATTATINITGGALSAPINTTLAPGELKEIILPWVIDLKGTTFNTSNTSGNRVSSSVRVNGGAYHMTSSIPVTAWQFSPLEYHLDPEPAGCIDGASVGLGPTECASVTNDASMLIPSTAMTGAYRAFSFGGEYGGDWGDAPGAIAVTAVQNNTLVKVQLTGAVVAGTGVSAAAAGSTVEFTMNAGDVVQLLGTAGNWSVIANSELSGSVVVGLDASNPGTNEAPNYKPVQVIGLSPIADLTPSTQESYADHVEETVLPAEVLGNQYIVAPPTGKSGSPVKHRVRFIGSVDGTNLTYQGTAPGGAPTTLSAGQMRDVEATTAFIVASQDAAHPFLVVSFIAGDEPSASLAISPEQFRKAYSFLAPPSYPTNYIDVLVPDGATVTLDGAAIGGYSTAIGSTGWSVRRMLLTAGPGGDGKHKLESNLPVGLQVMGYGWATSYYYPGGLKLDIISDPPIIGIE